MTMTPDADQSIRCTASSCGCLCFKPGSLQLRLCDCCGHSWVLHAMEKLHTHSPSSCSPVEVALPGLVFDLSSLVLYGAHAIPVRLKILLDRLFSVLSPEQVGHILQALGWTLTDYIRGYMLQITGGVALDRWLMVTPEEELFILKQFLRFGETRPIVELMTIQCKAAVNHLAGPDTSIFMERTGRMADTVQSVQGESRLGVFQFKKKDSAESVSRHFENLPGGLSLLLPFHFPSSAFSCFPIKDFVPSSKFTQFLWKSSGTNQTEPDRGDRTREEDLPPTLHHSSEMALKIKADPDKAAPAPWPQICQFPGNQERTSSFPPSLNSSLISPSSHHPSVSSPPKISQKLPGSSSSSPCSLSPLPSFSSFLCPLPPPSFSSSLHPLPSSLCSLSSSSGGRKGRVCCGVCGKSFYDKGTLKIHYNAVHLKIKHRCTVMGCTMVFSSLRSRNRHSANPNPRLHTGANRDVQRPSALETREDKHVFKDTCKCRVIEDARQPQAHTSLDVCKGSTPPCAADRSPPPSRAPPCPQLPPAHTASCPDPSFISENFHTDRRTPSPLTGHTPITKHKQAPTIPLANQQWWWESGDPAPKKKPRKSSMPVKIEREKEDGGNEEEEEG